MTADQLERAREGRHCPVCMEGLGALYYKQPGAPEECPECLVVATKMQEAHAEGKREGWNLAIQAAISQVAHYLSGTPGELTTEEQATQVAALVDGGPDD